MVFRVAVADPLPLFRHGVSAALLGINLVLECPEDLLSWTEERQGRVVVLSLTSTADWRLLSELRPQERDLIVVALLETDDTDACIRAFSSGATAVLGRDCEPSILRETVESALTGRTSLAVDVVRRLASNVNLDSSTKEPPSSRDVAWLQHLAEGGTVEDLARRAGYSERMMFRRLNELYQRIGASGRTDALLLARARGWI